MSNTTYIEEVPEFGDRVSIEMKRYRVENEFYHHKVIGVLKSNVWVDVPVQSPAKEVMHDEIEVVARCICEGVDETEVLKYRIKDIKLIDSVRRRAIRDTEVKTAEKVLGSDSVIDMDLLVENYKKPGGSKNGSIFWAEVKRIRELCKEIINTSLDS